MKNILVATDFSTRSDRALRRAVLLARAGGAGLTLLHVVDDDQPPRIVEAEREAARTLLDEHVATLLNDDGVACEARVVLADPFAGIAAATTAGDVDLLVLGPHRRRALRDVFTGTTAQRALKDARCPVLMANGPPAGPYRHALYATDLSPCAAQALSTARALGIDAQARCTLLHVFDPPGLPLAASRGVAAADTAKALEAATADARRALAQHGRAAQCADCDEQVRLAQVPVAETVLATAAECSADLIVAGTRGQGGVVHFVIGSVASEILRRADRDVLVVPPMATAKR